MGRDIFGCGIGRFCDTMQVACNSAMKNEEKGLTRI
jgi:hypothetical protein